MQVQQSSLSLTAPDHIPGETLLHARQLFMMLAHKCGGIGPLLDAFFSFLFRKTDFFHVMKEGENMGFLPGVAEKLVVGHFRKYEQMAAKGRVAAQNGGTKAAEAPAGSSKGQSSAPKPAVTKQGTPEVTAAAPAAAAPPPPPATGSAAATTAAIEASHLNSAVAAESTYNGGKTDKYVWEQTITDVTITVPLPPGTRSKDISCSIRRGHVRLDVRGVPEPVLDDDYPCDDRNNQCVWEQVKPEQSFWNFGDGKVTIYLEKERESWWKSALHAHAEIDTTKVDSVKRVEDYDGETQGAIRKIMFDQEQKRKGLPTSDELKHEELLRTAWDAEGSPFKGQPFDASVFNLSPSSTADGILPPGPAGAPPPLPPGPERGTARMQELGDDE